MSWWSLSCAVCEGKDGWGGLCGGGESILFPWQRLDLEMIACNMKKANKVGWPSRRGLAFLLSSPTVCPTSQPPARLLLSLSSPFLSLHHFLCLPLQPGHHSSFSLKQIFLKKLKGRVGFSTVALVLVATAKGCAVQNS